MQLRPQTTSWKWLACAILALAAFLPPHAAGQTGGRSNTSPGVSVVPPSPPQPPTSDAVSEILASFDIPVIFITAYPEKLLTGERPEPTYLIAKPFLPETVQATVGQALFFHPAAREAA